MKQYLILFALSVVLFSNCLYAENVDDLIAQLKDSDPSVVCKAAQMLGETKNRKAVPPLLAIVVSSNTSSDTVRVSVINALSNFRDSRVIKTLLEKVKDSSNSAEVRQASGKVIGKYSNKSILRVFENELRSGDKIRQTAALESLGYIGSNQAVALITHALGDRHLREYAITALGHTKNPKGVAALLSCMDNAFIKDEAVEALINMNDPIAFKPLAEKMASKRLSREIRLKILDHVIESGHEDSSKYIKRAMSDRLFAKDAAERLLESKDPQIRGLVSDAMAGGNLGSSSTTKAIRNMLESPKPEDLEVIGQALAAGKLRSNDKVKAVDYLIGSKKTEAIPFLGQALVTGRLRNDEESKIIQYLLTSNKPEVITPLGQALATGKMSRDEQPKLVEYLINSKKPETIPFLGQALTKCRFRNGEESKIINHLFNFDKPEVLPFLGQALTKGLIKSSKSREVIKRLGESKDSLNAQYLTTSVMDRFNHASAVEALLKIGGPSIAKPIAPALVVGNEETRDKVYNILMAVDEPWLVPTLIDMLKKESKSKRKGTWSNTSTSNSTPTSAKTRMLDKMNKSSRTGRSRTIGTSSRTGSSGKMDMSKLSGPHFQKLNDLFLKKVQPEDIDTIVGWLARRSEQTFAVELLKKLNWKPTTTSEKIDYYIAAKQWDKCKTLGEPVIEPLLDYIKGSAEAEPVMTLVQMGASQQAKKILEDKLKNWSLGKQQAEVIKGQLGWTAKTLKNRVDYAIVISDHSQLEKMWKKDTQVKSYLIDRLNNGNTAQVIDLSITLRRKDMVNPIISYLNRIEKPDYSTESIVNLLLNSGNQKLYDAAEAYVKRNDGTITEMHIGMSNSRWGD